MEYLNPKNYFKNFLRRVKMVISINRNRLEPHHLDKIRQEEKKEEENEKKEEKSDIIGNRKLKRVLNEVFLDNLKKSEIRRLKKEKKELAEKYKKRIEENEKKEIKTKKNMAEEIKEDLNDMTFFDRNILGFNKEYDLKLYNQKIKKLEDYSLEDYLKYYLKKEEKKQEEEGEKTKRRRKRQKKKKKSKNDDEDEELKDKKLEEFMEMENEFGKEVEKEMMEEEISEEETKIDLNEENQDIVDKIFELKKLEKEKKFTYTLKANFKKRGRRRKIDGK